jgi:hypothetical protein
MAQYTVERRIEQMRIQKTVSQKVKDANRENARESTGPTSVDGKAAARYNAVTHGLLAKRIILNNEEEKAEFQSLMGELEEKYRPQDIVERTLVEEVAVCLWKLGILLNWELQEIGNRRGASKALISALAPEASETQFPLFQEEGSSYPASSLSWDCNELMVKGSSKQNTKEKPSPSCEQEQKIGVLEFEAKLTSSMDTILRYQAAVKRDLYKALKMLTDLQSDRSDSSSMESRVLEKGQFTKRSH